MFENPGDEVYFGEVYRQVLQEPWLPGGADVWEVLGKSRRGRRPSQLGITGPNVSPTQEEVRRWFSKCASAWRELPWEIPPPATCDNRHGRKYWKDEKDRLGLMCSYYDLYMRYCLRFALDTGCIPPANYLLKVEPVLTDIECNKVYDLMFPNKCGEVSMVSGDGEFVSPSEWVSPKCGTEGELCFKDENGSLGLTTYKFSPLHWCTEFIWPTYNPTKIDPDVSKPVYVEGGVPPYSWFISGEGFSLANPITHDPVNPLYASPGACGTCKISVIDICGNECSGLVLCSAGQWLEISHLCPMKGKHGTITGVNGLDTTFEYIEGNKKQVHTNTWTGGSSVESCADSHYVDCLDYCETPPGLECEHCIDWDPEWHVFRTPCRDNPDEDHPEAKTCFINRLWKYYEWQC